MKNFFKKFNSYSFWVSLSGAVVILLNALGRAFGFQIENQIVEDCIMSIAGILVVLGIVTMNEQPSQNEQNDDNENDDNESSFDEDLNAKECKSISTLEEDKPRKNNEILTQDKEEKVEENESVKEEKTETKAG